MAEFRGVIRDFPTSWFSASMGTRVFATAPYLRAQIYRSSKIHDFFENPVKANFYVTFGIALLTLASNFSIVQPIYSLYLIFWLSGSLFVIAMELIIMAIPFIGTKVKIKHINPSWFLGATGLLLIPGTGNIIIHNAVISLRSPLLQESLL